MVMNFLKGLEGSVLKTKYYIDLFVTDRICRIRIICCRTTPIPSPSGESRERERRVHRYHSFILV